MKILLWVVVGLMVLAVIGAIAGEDTADQGKPAAKKPVEVSAEDVADLVGEEKFCDGYSKVLASGLGEDAAFGAFLRGYRNAPGDIPAREVFDELVNRC